MKKAVEVGVPFAQGRRIDCDSCGQPFTYLHFGIRYEENRDILIETSARKLEEFAVQFALRWIRHEAHTPKRGLGLCPHCKCYQGWMVRRSYVDHSIKAALAGLVVFGLIPFVYGVLNARYWQQWTWLYITGAIAGAIVGALVCRFLGLRRGPHDVKDLPASRTDAELKKLLEQYGQGDPRARPAVDWLSSIDVEVPLPFLKRISGAPLKTSDLKEVNELIIDAGFRDDAKSPLIPEHFHARPAIDRAEQRLADAAEGSVEETV